MLMDEGHENYASLGEERKNNRKKNSLVFYWKYFWNMCVCVCFWGGDIDLDAQVLGWDRGWDDAGWSRILIYMHMCNVVITLLNSLVAFYGTMYWVSMIILWLRDSLFMGSTQVVYYEVFDKLL